jgi:hypothetical protein
MGTDPKGREIHWSAYPEILKPDVDRAFCEGINAIVFHTLTAQRPQDGMPGFEYGAGTHFNPNVTWWNQTAGPWIAYINRCQAMLQRGLFVADVLYYNGDWAPNLVPLRRIDPGLGQGYDYDVCNEEILLTRLAVGDDGRIVLPNGMSYRMLVLPEETRMPAPVAKKIAELVKAGATILGPPPSSDPGLFNYPENDQTVRAIAAELWAGIDGTTKTENRVSKGRVFHGRTPRDILTSDGIQPDFEVTGGDGKSFIDFIHRRDAGADWYFLCNRSSDRKEAGNLLFRQTGRQPELWDPLTGEQRLLPEYQIKVGGTQVPLVLEPYESAFIVFRKAPVQTNGRNVASVEPVQTINGPWQVRFDSQWFYPVEDGITNVIEFPELIDWTEHPMQAVKHFSGTAVYQNDFTAPPTLVPNARYFLSLGGAGVSAKVRLNGQDLGVAWCHPWRVEATSALKPGTNRLEIEVVNTWQNRLVGDGFLAEDQRRTRTNMTAFYNRQRSHLPMPSGLRGPVILQLTKNQ